MTVKSMLAEKGADVATIGPDETLSNAAGMLSSRKIGALVVTRGDDKIVGILSERDVVRSLAAQGAEALNRPVRVFMTQDVKRCSLSHTVNDVMSMMTDGRFRHLPVEEDGKLIGIVSIGDVVKRKIGDAEREAKQLRDYIRS